MKNFQPLTTRLYENAERWQAPLCAHKREATRKDKAAHGGSADRKVGGKNGVKNDQWPNQRRFARSELHPPKEMPSEEIDSRAQYEQQNVRNRATNQQLGKKADEKWDEAEEQSYQGAKHGAD